MHILKVSPEGFADGLAVKCKRSRGIKYNTRIWSKKFNRWWQHLLRRKRLIEGPVWNRRRNQEFWLKYITFNVPIKYPSN